MKKLFLFTLGILLLASFTPQKENKEKSPSEIDIRVENILRQMSLEEKVSQLYAFRIHDTLAWDEGGNFLGVEDTARLKLGSGDEEQSSARGI